MLDGLFNTVKGEIGFSQVVVGKHQPELGLIIVED
jgi:hypothetical protein